MIPVRSSLLVSFSVSPKQIITVCGESRRKQTTERIYKINQLSVTLCEGPCQLRGRLQFRRCFYCLCCVSVNLTVRNGLKAHLCTDVFIISDQLSRLDLFVIPHGLYIVSRCNTDAHHWNKYTALKTFHQKWKYVIIYVCSCHSKPVCFLFFYGTQKRTICVFKKFEKITFEWIYLLYYLPKRFGTTWV